MRDSNGKLTNISSEYGLDKIHFYFENNNIIYDIDSLSFDINSDSFKNLQQISPFIYETR